jgi:ectoine hydroxylase-related dioxygenase (phytanoyl-CoA dioxygenase family)
MEMYESYGVLKRQASITEIDKVVEEVRLLGYSSIDSGFTNLEIQQIKEVCEATARDYKIKYQDMDLILTGESNNHRAPLLEDLMFLRVAQNEKIIEIISRLIIGEFFLNQQNLVVNPPSSKNYNQLKFHRDLPYQHYVSSKPIAINALFAVDDFTMQNGATIVIPASHKMEEFSSDVVIDNQAKQIEVKAGSFLILDCMTFHAAASNMSGADRVGINHVYSTLMLRPQIDWERAVSKEIREKLDVNQRKLLGLNHPIAGSVRDFLQNRMAR